MSTVSAEQINAALRGFDRLYGLEIETCSDTEARARVAIREEVKQPAGLVHGGVYASMA
jgi:acyl-coenzyme A thioesterase PaaI-like protein